VCSSWELLLLAASTWLLSSFLSTFLRQILNVRTEKKSANFTLKNFAKIFEEKIVRWVSGNSCDSWKSERFVFIAYS